VLDTSILTSSPVWFFELLGSWSCMYNRYVGTCRQSSRGGFAYGLSIVQVSKSDIESKAQDQGIAREVWLGESCCQKIARVKSSDFLL
jgi:hypothetical protein